MPTNDEILRTIIECLTGEPKIPIIKDLSIPWLRKHLIPYKQRIETLETRLDQLKKKFRKRISDLEIVSYIPQTTTEVLKSLLKWNLDAMMGDVESLAEFQEEALFLEGLLSTLGDPLGSKLEDKASSSTTYRNKTCKTCANKDVSHCETCKMEVDSRGDCHGTPTDYKYKKPEVLICKECEWQPVVDCEGCKYEYKVNNLIKKPEEPKMFAEDYIKEPEPSECWNCKFNIDYSGKECECIPKSEVAVLKDSYGKRLKEFLKLSSSAIDSRASLRGYIEDYIEKELDRKGDSIGVTEKSGGS